MHEYLAYTTEETEKMEVRELAEKLGGDMEAAIRQIELAEKLGGDMEAAIRQIAERRKEEKQ